MPVDVAASFFKSAKPALEDLGFRHLIVQGDKDESGNHFMIVTGIRSGQIKDYLSELSDNADDGELNAKNASQAVI